MIEDILLDNIFQDFICSCDITLDNSLILLECEETMQKNAGINRSNVNGWHSEVFSLNKPSNLYNINDLAQHALDFANIMSENLGLKNVYKNVDFWINVNKENSYNVVHGHPRADLSLVYYVKVNKLNGELTLMRSDGAHHTLLYKNRPQQLRYSIQPITGRMYCFPAHILHYVTTNLSEEDRISIAFNVY
jgi:uncharacterized protein (TIGR02466 family)